MTTIDAAAAWRTHKSVAGVALAALMGLGLAGCETSTQLFGNTAQGPDATVAGQAAALPQTQVAKIAIAPVIGAPDTVAKQLQTQLSTNIEAQRVSVAKQPTDPAEFTLRGYVVAAREKTRTKVSYIWDVTDQSGRRVNRITGEEVVVGPQQKDPWASVTPEVVQTIATKTSGSLAAWLPTQASPAVAQNSSAATVVGGQAPQAGTVSAPAVAGSLQTAPAPQKAAFTQPATGAGLPPSSSATTTGSIGRDAAAVTALVPSVVGAPGDGSVALTSALQRELTKNGVALADRPGGQSYRVEGKVVVGEGQNGKQPIQIDWNVKDPAGKKLGTVSQKNEIPQGSLDGAWGKTADAAAAAAAQGILKLLPGQTKVN